MAKKEARRTSVLLAPVTVSFWPSRTQRGAVPLTLGRPAVLNEEKIVTMLGNRKKRENNDPEPA
jgi:hypothetical protein